jgi:hypothetical protein
MTTVSLSGADLRGADFHGADLHDADLSRVRTGMSRGWAALLFIGSASLSLALGIVVGLGSRTLHAMLASNDARLHMCAMFVLASMLVFAVAGIWRGLRFATYDVLPVTAALAVAAGIIAVITRAGTGIAAALALVFVAAAAAMIGLCVLVRATGGASGKLFFMVTSIVGALAAGAAGGGVGATIVVMSAVLMAKRSEKLEARYPMLARATAAIASRGGTCFRNANLAGANLERAHLVACDFRGANLERAKLDGAELRLCRFDRDNVKYG